MSFYSVLHTRPSSMFKLMVPSPALQQWRQALRVNRVTDWKFLCELKSTLWGPPFPRPRSPTDMVPAKE